MLGNHTYAEVKCFKLTLHIISRVATVGHLVLWVVVKVSIVGGVAWRLVEIVIGSFQQQVRRSLGMSPGSSWWAGGCCWAGPWTRQNKTNRDRLWDKHQLRGWSAWFVSDFFTWNVQFKPFVCFDIIIRKKTSEVKPNRQSDAWKKKKNLISICTWDKSFEERRLHIGTCHPAKKQLKLLSTAPSSGDSYVCWQMQNSHIF